MSAAPAEHLERTAEPGQSEATDEPWATIVWNDPVNLMSYVTYVFQAYFGYSRDKAERLMLEVHHEGRSIVSSGPRERIEADVQAMHAYGLWATMSHPGGEG
jgi:ATP-dependent Clp protease adaptor protein ClpS